MSKAVFLTHGNKAANRPVAEFLLRQGFRLSTHAEDDPDAITALQRSIAASEGLDVLIHGSEWLDEGALLERDPHALERTVNAHLRSLFDLSRTAGMHMARKKRGQILFILFNDHWEGGLFPSSPILNHAKLAMMKTLAKELAPYRIGVNAVTFGYCIPETEPDSAAVTTAKKPLDIYALKPALMPHAELVPLMDWLLHAEDHRMSGQHVQLGAGMDTPL